MSPDYRPRWDESRRGARTFDDQPDDDPPDDVPMDPPVSRLIIDRQQTILEIRQMVADMIVTLDAPNPRYALSTAIGAVDAWLQVLSRVERTNAHDEADSTPEDR